MNRALRAIRRSDVVALVIDAMQCVTEQVGGRGQRGDEEAERRSGRRDFLDAANLRSVCELSAESNLKVGCGFTRDRCHAVFD